MAAAPQNQALEVIKTKIMQVEERYAGYRDDLTGALYDIVTLENDRPYNIAQQINRRFVALGERLAQKGGNTG